MSTERSTTFASTETTPVVDPTVLPHDQLDAIVGITPVVNLTMAQIGYTNDGKIGMRSATPGMPAIFRVGQQINLTTEAHHQTRTYYVTHDAGMRLFDPAADILPIEVHTFRQGLADREAARLEELHRGTGDPRSVDHDEIGAAVVRSEILGPAPSAAARLRLMGTMLIDSFRGPTTGPGRHRMQEAAAPFNANHTTNRQRTPATPGRHRAGGRHRS